VPFGYPSPWQAPGIARFLVLQRLLWSAERVTPSWAISHQFTKVYLRRGQLRCIHWR